MADSRRRLDWIGGDALRPLLHGAPYVEVTDELVRIHRLNPDDRRHPPDLWANALQPAGARIEFRAWASEVAVRLRYPDLGARAGFSPQPQVSLWIDGRRSGLRAPPTSAGDHELRFDLPVVGGSYVLYLPYLCRAEIVELGVEGRLERVPVRRPRWLAYGDSITHGWCASDPALTYPALASRAFGLEHVNLGFSGTARGEPSAAGTIAELPADVISLAFGTNIYKDPDHTRASWRATFETFLDVLREGHPDTPVLVVTPIYRESLSPHDHMAPGTFEKTPSGGGLLHDEIRAVEKDVVCEHIRDGDAHLALISGLDLIGMDGGRHLADGIHPNDAGLEQMGMVVGSQVRTLAVGASR